MRQLNKTAEEDMAAELEAKAQGTHKIKQEQGKQTHEWTKYRRLDTRGRDTQIKTKL